MKKTIIVISIVIAVASIAYFVYRSKQKKDAAAFADKNVTVKK